MVPRDDRVVYKGKIPFGNGQVYKSDRYFIVFSVDETHCLLCNCSSIRGKKQKLALPSNTELISCIPPLIERTMVKMDEVYRVEVECLSLLTPLPTTLTESTYLQFMEDFKGYLAKDYITEPAVIDYSYEEISKHN